MSNIRFVKPGEVVRWARPSRGISRTSGGSPGGLFQRQIVPRAAAPSSGLPRSPAARAGPGVTVFDLCAGAPYRAERPTAETSTEAPSGPFLVAEIVAPSVNLATACVDAQYIGKLHIPVHDTTTMQMPGCTE